MEARKLKREIAYVFTAIALGVAIMLAPLITRAEIKNDPQIWSARTLSEGFRDLEGPSSRATLPRFSESDIEVLSVCFVVALIIYVWSRSKLPEREYRWVGYVPY